MAQIDRGTFVIMVDDAVHSATAIAALSNSLSGRHITVAEADHALAEALTAAHSATVEAVQRLDAIAADIESAVAQQDAFALDTPAGAREFHRFLIAKHREIIDIVSVTAADSQSKSMALQQLLAHYSPSPAGSTI